MKRGLQIMYIISILLVISFIIILFIILQDSKDSKKEIILSDSTNQEVENKTILISDTIVFPVKDINAVTGTFCLNEVNQRWNKNNRKFESCQVDETFKLEDYQGSYNEGYRYMITCSCFYYVTF